MSDYWMLLERVIGDGIEAVKRDYNRERDERKQAGAIAGFEACRGRLPTQLAALLAEARLDRGRAHRDAHERRKGGTKEEQDNVSAKYWYWRCRESEIEWVCNVVSAVLANQGLPVLVPPTYRGAMKAAEILGVREQ